MAGQTVISGSSPVEFVEESTFATEESDASWNWFGLGTSWDVTQGAETETISYLPEANSTNKLSKKKNVQHSEMWEGSITYHPQTDFTFLKYFTGSEGGVSDDPPTIQVGQIDEENDEYQQMLGGMGEEVTVSVDEDSSFEVDGSFIFADATDWLTQDYVGTGSHATEDTTEPMKYAELSNVQYGGADLSGAIESLEFTVSNEIAQVKDPDAPRDTLIAALVPTDREITVDVTLTYSGFDMASEVRDYTAKDFTFDINGTSFTISDVQFPEFTFAMEPEDLISDSVSSDPATNISWS